MLKTSVAARPAGFNFTQLAGRILYLILIAVPLVVWPGLALPDDILKQYLLSFLLLFTGGAGLLWAWRPGNSRRLSSFWLVALALPVMAGLFAGLLSGAARHSLFGLGFEYDTVLALFFWSFLAAAVPLWWHRRQDTLNALIILLGLGLVVGLFQWTKIVLFNFTSVSWLTPPAVNLIGKWNELGIFLGLVLLSGLALWEYLPQPRRPLISGLIIVSGSVAFSFLLLVNYRLLWLGLGLTALFLGLERWWSAPPDRAFYQRLFRPSLLLAALALLLVWLGPPGALAGVVKTDFDWGQAVNAWNIRLGIQTIEVTPSWEGTWQVATAVLARQPLRGIGPNKFINEWFRSRPAVVNETIFWQNDFRAGVGVVPTMFITTGLIGFFGYLLLLVGLVLTGYRWLRTRSSLDPLVFGLGLTVWLGAVYLWFFNFNYVTGTVLLMLAYFWLGLVIKTAHELSPSLGWPAKQPTNQFRLLPALGAWWSWWSSVFGRLLAGAAIIVLLLVCIQSAWSYWTYRRGVAEVINGDFDQGEMLIARAASFNPNDLFYRSLVDIDLILLDRLLTTPNQPATEAQERFERTVLAAIGNGRAAVTYNPTNYLNWLFLARVYEAVVPFNVTGAYDEAVKAYNEAARLAPRLPLIQLNRARLEIIANNQTLAREQLLDAIRLKRNYSEAIFILAQLDAQSGNLSNAIRLAEEAVRISPSEPIALFNLGLLHYQNKNYTQAQTALEAAVAASPDYANARYFLGLTYDFLGRRREALAQFEIILQTNDLPEIRTIIGNLRSGRSALFAIPPPAPEDRETLPLSEE